MIPKYFLIIYFNNQDIYNTVQLEKRLAQLHTAGVDYSIQGISGQLGSFAYISDKQILSGTINKIVETFGDSFVDIIYMHHTDSPFDDETQSLSSQPAYVASFGLVLSKQSFWDYLFLKRFFFLMNLAKLILNSQSHTGFEVNGDIVTFYLQGQRPVLNVEIDFLAAHFQNKGIQYLKTVI